MTSLGALTTWGPTGVITATIVNNNFSAIRTHINSYLAQIDASNSWTAAQTFAAAVTCSSGNLTATGGELAVVRSSASAIMRMNSTGGSGRSYHFASQNSDGHFLFVDATASGIRWRVDTDGHVLPGSDGTYNLGSGSAKWLTLHVGTVTATSLGGALTTAAQTAITSVGTLTGLTVSGSTSLAALTCTGAVSIEGNTTIGNAATDTLSIACNSITLTGTAPELYCGNAAGGTVFNLSNAANTGNYIAISDPNGDSATSATMTLMGGFSLGTLHLGGAGLATNATKGFIEIPDMAGTPTGAAANTSVVIDTSNLRLYIRIAGTWRYAALT